MKNDKKCVFWRHLPDTISVTSVLPWGAGAAVMLEHTLSCGWMKIWLTLFTTWSHFAFSFRLFWQCCHFLVSNFFFLYCFSQWSKKCAFFPVISYLPCVAMYPLLWFACWGLLRHVGAPKLFTLIASKFLLPSVFPSFLRENVGLCVFLYQCVSFFISLRGLCCCQLTEKWQPAQNNL